MAKQTKKKKKDGATKKNKNGGAKKKKNGGAKKKNGGAKKQKIDGKTKLQRKVNYSRNIFFAPPFVFLGAGGGGFAIFFLFSDHP